MNRRTILLATLGLGALPAAGWGQAGDEPLIFRRTFPHPTGRNGLEDLVRAADELRSSRLYSEVEVDDFAPMGVPLGLRRRVLRDPPVTRALALLRRGLVKPMAWPDGTIDADAFPAFAGFRSLARLLAMQEVVFLADGQVAEAFGSARVSFLLGRAVGTIGLVSWLVGAAIISLGISPLAAHLGQLSAADCERLFALCGTFAEPDPMPRVLEAERKQAKQLLARIRREDPDHPEGLLPDYDDDPAAKAETQRTATEIRRMVSAPGGLDAFYGELERHIDSAFDRLAAEARKPAWEQAEVDAAGDRSPAAQAAAVFVTPLPGVGEVFARGPARLRLLACHAAVRRYLWEHDRLPTDLEALDLGEVAVDPFVGTPLQYVRLDDRHYRLFSVGQKVADDNPRAVNGRFPYSIVPGE